MKKLIPSILVFIFFAGMVVSFVHAQTPPPPPASQGSVNVTGTLQNPFKGGGDLYALAQMVVEQLILPIGGILATLAFIWSGFLYVSAQGEPKKISEAKNALINSAIGTAILLGSWVIASVIKNTIFAFSATK